jgi:hypothetical protein
VSWIAGFGLRLRLESPTIESRQLPNLADIVAKVQNCSAPIFSSETKVTAIADKYGAKLVSEVASEFVTTK